jgi:hypothetical protein
MQHFKFPNPLDCWLRTDHLKPDFEACAERFVQRGGSLGAPDAAKRPPVQPWEARAANSSANDGFAVSRHAAGEAFADRRNTQSYPKCAELFADQALRDLVYRVDGGLAKQFGFDECCGASRRGSPMPAPWQ